MFGAHRKYHREDSVCTLWKNCKAAKSVMCPRAIIYWTHWVDCILKLFLNLWKLSLFSPTINWVKYAIPLGVWIPYTELAGGLINENKFFLKNSNWSGCPQRRIKFIPFKQAVRIGTRSVLPFLPLFVPLLAGFEKHSLYHASVE